MATKIIAVHSGRGAEGLRFSKKLDYSASSTIITCHPNCVFTGLETPHFF